MHIVYSTANMDAESRLALAILLTSMYARHDLLLTLMCVSLKAWRVVVSDCNSEMSDCDDDKDRDDSLNALGILLTCVDARLMICC